MPSAEIVTDAPDVAGVDHVLPPFVDVSYS